MKWDMIDPDLAFARSDEACEDLEQSGFSPTALPDDRDLLANLDL